MKFPIFSVQIGVVAVAALLSSVGIAQMSAPMPAPPTSTPPAPQADPKPNVPDAPPVPAADPAPATPAPSATADLPQCSKAVKHDCVTKSGKVRKSNH